MSFKNIKNDNLNIGEEETKNNEKSKNHFCNLCNYNTYRKFNYKKHIETTKHKNKEEPNESKKLSTDYTCNICEKYYKTTSGLWKHNKIHKIEKIDNYNNLIKESNELKELISKQHSIILNLIKDKL